MNPEKPKPVLDEPENKPSEGNSAYQRKADRKYNPEDDESLLDMMSRKKAAARARMAYARSFVTTPPPPGIPQKWSHELVSDIRTTWMATKEFRHRFTMPMLAKMYKIPIETVRKMLYRSDYHRDPTAQINPHKIAECKARVMEILRRHEEIEEELRRDRRSAKRTKQDLSVGEIAKITAGPRINPDLRMNTEDFQTQQVISEDQKIFRELDAIIGRPPMTPAEVADAVAYYARRGGRYLSNRQVIDLRRKYAIHHGLI